MRPGKTLLLLFLPPLSTAGAWAAYGSWLRSSLPKVEIREVTPLATVKDRELALPFFELMSPLPAWDGHRALPKLEYKKGPPERFLERISVLLRGEPQAGGERIVYYGRHTRDDLRGISAFPEEPAREAHYIEAAIRLSQGEPVPGLHGWKGFLLGPLLLREAARWLPGIAVVSIMDQAGTPAFLFESAPGSGGRERATALFMRRAGFYRVDYLGDRGFALLDPASLFRRTFLTERRADALEFLARHLSEVRLGSETSEKGQERDFTWPALLLAAHLSVNPSSLDSYLHLAGISTLLYRMLAGEQGDLEIADALRNNVFASDLYAQDIGPETPTAREIARLARLLKRNFN